jgi:hypothetical protein
MLHYLKKSIFIICCILTFVSCNGQTNSKDFDLFLSNFENFNFPLNPTEFIVDREAKLQSKSILKKDYEEYLRIDNDTFWIFKDYYEYRYGGKKKFDNCWILFYSRNFVPDDVNLQKSEIVLSTFTLDGKIISSLPIAGGYGDSLTFSSVINSISNIDVKYTLYQNNKEDTYTMQYFIGDGYILKTRD